MSLAGIKQTHQQLMALNEDFCVFLKDAGIMKTFQPRAALPGDQGWASLLTGAACAWLWMLRPQAWGSACSSHAAV